MNLAKKLSEILIFLASEAKCSIEPCKEIGWNEPLQSSGSVGATLQHIRSSDLKWRRDSPNKIINGSNLEYSVSSGEFYMRPTEAQG